MNGLPSPAASLLMRAATMHGGRYGTQRMATFRYLALRLPLSPRESCGARLYPHGDSAHLPAVANTRSRKGGRTYATELLYSAAFHPVSNCATINTADAGTTLCGGRWLTISVEKKGTARSRSPLHVKYNLHSDSVGVFSGRVAKINDRKGNARQCSYCFAGGRANLFSIVFRGKGRNLGIDLTHPGVLQKCSGLLCYSQGP